MRKEKTCTKCGEAKQLKCFSKKSAAKDGYRSSCKDCDNTYGREWHKNNAERVSKKNKEYNDNNIERKRRLALVYYHDNKEYYSKQRKKYYQENKEEVAEKAKVYGKLNRDKINKRRREWRKNNPDKDRASFDKYIKKRLLNDNVFALAKRTRGAIRAGLKRGGYKKRSRSEEILGCTFEEFKAHIERGFKKHPGMCWDRFDEIHLDHIIAISTADTEEDVLRLNRYTNFQPLWAEDNLKKSDKIIEGTQLTLA